MRGTLNCLRAAERDNKFIEAAISGKDRTASIVLRPNRTFMPKSEPWTQAMQDPLEVCLHVAAPSPFACKGY